MSEQGVGLTVSVGRVTLRDDLCVTEGGEGGGEDMVEWRSSRL